MRQAAKNFRFISKKPPQILALINGDTSVKVLCHVNWHNFLTRLALLPTAV
jgi:hypothetical protein